jgi:hypothetical protein
MTSKMTLSYRVFPSGQRVPGTPETTFPLSGGQHMTLDAQELLFEAGGPPANFTKYAFIFWDINSTAFTHNTANFSIPESAFLANAWYIGPIGGNGPPVPVVGLSAFSLDQHKVLAPTSPFVTVSPGTVSDLATRTSTSAPKVTITAEPVLSPDGAFKSWLTYGGTGAASGTGAVKPTLTVPEGDGCSAIAFYALTKLSPDPCQHILNEIHALGPVPPVPLGGQLPPAFKALFEQLVACQAANGEPQTPPTQI